MEPVVSISLSAAKTFYDVLIKSIEEGGKLPECPTSRAGNEECNLCESLQELQQAIFYADGLV